MMSSNDSLNRMLVRSQTIGLYDEINNTVVGSIDSRNLTVNSTDVILGEAERLILLMIFPEKAFISILVYLGVNITISLGANAILIVTIIFSPSLRTPPNAQLVSICINNVIVTMAMVSGVASLVISKREKEAGISYVLLILGEIQLFIITMSMFLYLASFASIGVYRLKTIKKPTMSIRSRRVIIRRSIIFGWLIAIIIAAMVVLTYGDGPSTKNMVVQIDSTNASLNEQPSYTRRFVLCFVFICILIGYFVIINAYYRIISVKFSCYTTCENRVAPGVVDQDCSSISSDDQPYSVEPRRPCQNYIATTSNNWTAPFTISKGALEVKPGDNLVAHFHHPTQSITFHEEVLALENPIEASKGRSGSADWQPLHQTLQARESNTSTYSNKTQRPSPDFTDISPAAEITRFRKLKNKSVLRNYSLKRDRTSSNGATKNSLVMLLLHFLLSMPIIICAIPGALALLDLKYRILCLACCKLLYFMNTPMFPLWYLLFSKRVKSSLYRFYENTLAKLNRQ